MSFSICKKLGLNPIQTNKKVIQLDKTEVNVVGELRDIHVQVGSDPRILTNIDIQVADIPETYGMLLSRDLIKNLGGYLALDFSHMWLSWKGIPNQIRIESEPRLKDIITKYDCLNELAYFETEMGVYKQEEILTFSVLNAKDMSKQKNPNPTIDENQQALVRKLQQDQLVFGADIDLQSLMLPNWCRVHYQSHSELTCQPCKDILNHVSQAKEAGTSRPETIADCFSFEAKEVTMLTWDTTLSKEIPSHIKPTLDT